jgi:hypothetical protein
MKRLHLIWALPAVLGTTLVAALPSHAQENTATETAAPVTTVVEEKFGQGVVFPFSLLDAALEKRVNREGEINYAQLKDDKNLERFVRAVATADLSKFPVFKAVVVEENPNSSKKKQELPKDDHSWEMVFWINAYNAHVLKTIADAYPLNNVSGIKDFDTAQTHAVAGQNYSFEQMRKKIAALEPRALFALIDGTRSGPALAPRAYRWSDLAALLEANARAFVNNPRNVELTRIQNKVAVSDFLATVDEAFRPKGARRKWDGIRWLLAAYTDQRANRSFFTTGEYQVSFTPRSQELNDWTHSDE